MSSNQMVFSFHNQDEEIAYWRQVMLQKASYSGLVRNRAIALINRLAAREGIPGWDTATTPAEFRRLDCELHHDLSQS